MKTTRMIIGIVGIVLALVIFFQSCAAGFVEAIEEDTKSTASAAGVMVALSFIVAGIIAICTRRSAAGGFVCFAIYAISGIIGLAGHGMYTDLIVWGSISLVFAVVFLITSIVMIKQKNNV